MIKLISTLLLILIFNYSYSQKSSSTIEEAILQAKKENKQVFVNYFSTDCKHSKDMEKQMKNNLFTSNYIIVNIEVLKEETSDYVNCSNPVKAFKANNCEEIKFPFWYILDESGNYTATSFKEDNSNIGYPSTKENLNDFIKIIRNTSKFTETTINKIENSFLKVASK